MTAFENELLDRLERRGVYSNTSVKYEMRPYQIEAKEKWNANNHNGFFVMATGTGKTITSLYSIKEFVTDNRIFTVIAVPYKHLVSQWAEDVKEFFPDASVHVVHGEIKDGETKIVGELLTVNDDGFASMDRLEGYPRLYRREQIDVFTARGGRHRAWVYIMNELPKTAILIEGGDWRNRNR